MIHVDDCCPCASMLHGIIAVWTFLCEFVVFLRFLAVLSDFKQMWLRPTLFWIFQQVDPRMCPRGFPWTPSVLPGTPSVLLGTPSGLLGTPSGLLGSPSGRPRYSLGSPPGRTPSEPVVGCVFEDFNGFGSKFCEFNKFCTFWCENDEKNIKNAWTITKMFDVVRFCWMLYGIFWFCLIPYGNIENIL